MNEHAKFFDSKDGDRKYNANDFREWLRDLYPTGVMENGFFVTANDDMTVTVGAGFVNIGGSVKTFEETTLTVPAAGPSDRIDAVIIELNEDEKDIAITYAVGTQTAPTPVRTDTVYQLIPAEITVKSGATSITQADITDTRMVNDICGYIVRLVDSYDFTTILTEYNDFLTQFITDNFDEFDDWFQQMQGVFSASNIATVTTLVQNIQSSVSGYQDDMVGYTGEAASLHNRFDAVVASGGSQKFRRASHGSGYDIFVSGGEPIAYDVEQSEWDKLTAIFLGLEAQFSSRGETSSSGTRQSYCDCVLVRPGPSYARNYMYGSANFLFFPKTEINGASSGQSTTAYDSVFNTSGKTVPICSVNFRVYYDSTLKRIYADRTSFEINILELMPGNNQTTLFQVSEETPSGNKRYYQANGSASAGTSVDSYSNRTTVISPTGVILVMEG